MNYYRVKRLRKTTESFKTMYAAVKKAAEMTEKTTKEYVIEDCDGTVICTINKGKFNPIMYWTKKEFEDIYKKTMEVFECTTQLKLF